jgi:tetratricopeptide (TPR) repeat protein
MVLNENFTLPYRLKEPNTKEYYPFSHCQVLVGRETSIAVKWKSQIQQRRLLVARGIYFLNTGLLQKALETADELKELIESGLNKNLMRDYNYLLGLIEHEKKNYFGAVEYLEMARSQLRAEWSSIDMQAKRFFALGQGQHKVGDFNEAQKAYAEIFSMTLGRNYYPHFYVLAFYELGRVFQDQGNTAEAIKHYKKFLDLWKDADPGLPEVEDVKKRLTGLR